MTRQREDLIRDLAARAVVPVGSLRPVPVRALNWLLVTALIALTAIVVHAPLRDGSLAAVLASPTRAAAFGIGVVVVVSASLMAFRSGVPSAIAPVRYALWPMVALAVWLLLLGFSAQHAGQDPASDQKRLHCWLEVLAFAGPGLALGLLAVRKLWPVHGAWTGALLGLAAGATTALIMDLACDPSAGHSLLFHVLPGAAVAVPGALLGARLLRRP